MRLNTVTARAGSSEPPLPGREYDILPEGWEDEMMRRLTAPFASVVLTRGEADQIIAQVEARVRR